MKKFEKVDPTKIDYRAIMLDTDWTKPVSGAAIARSYNKLFKEFKRINVGEKYYFEVLREFDKFIKTCEAIKIINKDRLKIYDLNPGFTAKSVEEWVNTGKISVTVIPAADKKYSMFSEEKYTPVVEEKKRTARKMAEKFPTEDTNARVHNLLAIFVRNNTLVVNAFLVREFQEKNKYQKTHYYNHNGVKETMTIYQETNTLAKELCGIEKNLIEYDRSRDKSVINVSITELRAIIKDIASITDSSRLDSIEIKKVDTDTDTKEEVKVKKEEIKPVVGKTPTSRRPAALGFGLGRGTFADLIPEELKKAAKTEKVANKIEKVYSREPERVSAVAEDELTINDEYKVSIVVSAIISEFEGKSIDFGKLSWFINESWAYTISQEECHKVVDYLAKKIPGSFMISDDRLLSKERLSKYNLENFCEIFYIHAKVETAKDFNVICSGAEKVAENLFKVEINGNYSSLMKLVKVMLKLRTGEKILPGSKNSILLGRVQEIINKKFSELS